MAERRMFAKTIVLSDAFLDMPLSARCLYFTLGMFADDDGFVNGPKSIMRQCGGSEDDLKLLAVKRFILPFESGVIVIKHWRINNYLRNDRYVPTKYKDELSELAVEENGAYTEVVKPDGVPGIPGIPSGGIPSIGKDRLDKDRIGKEKEIPKEKETASEFDVFWKAYPKKIGKEAARRAFAKATCDLLTMLSAIEAQKEWPQWKKDDGQYIPNPATWLNQGRWDDEISEQQEGSRYSGVV